jgi:hypothetical protein
MRSVAVFTALLNFRESTCASGPIEPTKNTSPIRPCRTHATDCDQQADSTHEWRRLLAQHSNTDRRGLAPTLRVSSSHVRGDLLLIRQCSKLFLGLRMHQDCPLHPRWIITKLLSDEHGESVVESAASEAVGCRSSIEAQNRGSKLVWTRKTCAPWDSNPEPADL